MTTQNPKIAPNSVESEKEFNLCPQSSAESAMWKVCAGLHRSYSKMVFNIFETNSEPASLQESGFPAEKAKCRPDSLPSTK